MGGTEGAVEGRCTRGLGDVNGRADEMQSMDDEGPLGAKSCGFITR